MTAQPNVPPVVVVQVSGFLKKIMDLAKGNHNKPNNWQHFLKTTLIYGFFVLNQTKFYIEPQSNR